LNRGAIIVDIGLISSAGHAKAGETR
jgi:hypothetical protein